MGSNSNIIKNGLILFIITGISGLLLGFVYEMTKDAIAEQEVIAKNKAMEAVSSEADAYEIVEFEDTTENMISINEISAALKNGDVIGYDFILTTKEGYGGDISVAVGLSVDGLVTGVEILSHAETPGLGAKADEPAFKGQYTGKPIDTFTVVKSAPSGDNDIEAITGATITSSAVNEAVNEAVSYYQDHLAKEAE